MSPGQTAERVYDLLKSQIMSGERPPGERLDPARLARELNASTTPVRDALHQLLGERMIQAFPKQGFQVPILNETGLRHLYRWMEDLLVILLRMWRGDGDLRTDLISQADVVDTTAALFNAIGGTLANAEHRRAIGNVNDRLHLVRILEISVLDDVGAEVDSLVRAWGAKDVAALRNGLQRYHHRRRRAVPAIAELIAGRAV